MCVCVCVVDYKKAQMGSYRSCGRIMYASSLVQPKTSFSRNDSFIIFNKSIGTVRVSVIGVLSLSTKPDEFVPTTETLSNYYSINFRAMFESPITDTVFQN